ncbi:MAG TPA: T9SS type A sorting domain-containing protein [Brumimicrobium sp.]|nr:T9SS type A sorting domain-containing protein [Brumimicrobium sp.]
MKKLMIIAAMFMTNVAFTNANIGEPVKTISHDSSSTKIKFEVERINSNQINVWVEGVEGLEGDFTSVSLIDQRGKSMFYQFIQTNDDHFSIDLTELSEGKYYVKLNMGNEIRMKVILIEK